MTEQAKQWDYKYRSDADKHVIENGKIIPINRPCDWCGKVVEKGYIHIECAKKEEEVWFDILY